MELKLWEIGAVFFAGVIATILGGALTGFLVYKTKYAGQEVFRRKEDHGGAESFNIDDEFDGSDAIKDYEAVEYPKETQKDIDNFEAQFNMQKMIKEAEKYQEVEDAA